MIRSTVPTPELFDRARRRATSSSAAASPAPRSSWRACAAGDVPVVGGVSGGVRASGPVTGRRREEPDL